MQRTHSQYTSIAKPSTRRVPQYCNSVRSTSYAFFLLCSMPTLDLVQPSVIKVALDKAASTWLLSMVLVPARVLTFLLSWLSRPMVLCDEFIRGGLVVVFKINSHRTWRLALQHALERQKRPHTLATTPVIQCAYAVCTVFNRSKASHQPFGSLECINISLQLCG